MKGFKDYILVSEETSMQVIKRWMSKTVSKKRYAYAAELTRQIYDRKMKETGGKPKHGIGWYADSVARQIDGIDTRILVSMLMNEEYGAGEEGTDSLLNKYKQETPGEIAEEAEYQGRKVKLNDPFRSNDGKHKFYVYVKNEKGNVIKLGFGDPNMEIKRDDPDRLKAFRARHGCDKDPGPKWKAKYWSCKMWEKGKKVSDLD
jgi:hypothetical protein